MASQSGIIHQNSQQNTKQTVTHMVYIHIGCVILLQYAVGAGKG